VLACMSATAARAESPIDLTVSPAILEWIAAPGQSQSKEIAVTNQTEKPQPVRAVVQKFAPREAVPKESADLFNATEWLAIKDPDFILKPKETRVVTVTATLPKEASPGGHYATIYFLQLRPSGESAPHTTVAGRVGTLAFISVKGAIKKEMKSLGQLLVTRQSGGYVFSTTLKNTGNTHLLPTVSLTIFDWRHHQVAKVAAVPGLLLPHTEREYEVRWVPSIAGKYTVEPSVTYGNGQQVALHSLRLWQVPWRFILPMVLSALFGWFGVYRIWPRWRRAWITLWKK